MKILLLTMMLIPAITFAEKKITKKDMSILGKIDESNFKQEESKKDAPLVTEPANNGPKLMMNCKEQDGREFKQGEVGYDSCLNGLKNRSEMSKRNSGVYGSDKKDQSNVGVTLKIGE